ncbi:MAG: hypothetical protein LAN84_11365 [Acidobacteriia bacterium]|nr:hypothetical protein [Terriglobia bacterium]
MRTLVSCFLLAAVPGLALFLIPSLARACTCEVYGDGSPRSRMHYAKAVFIGEVLEVREATKSEREEYSNAYIVRMRVDRYWKGIKSSEINVETDMTGCGPYFRVGEKFLVYGMGKRLNTACSGTCKLEYAEKDLKALGPGKGFKAK